MAPVELSWGQPHTSQPHTCQPHLFHLFCSHRLRQSQTISQHNQSFFLFYNSRLCRGFCTLGPLLSWLTAVQTLMLSLSPREP